jgi:hypothetical protein
MFILQRVTARKSTEGTRDGGNGLKTDAISLSNHCFIVLVFSRHHLPTQSAQLCKFYF